MRRFLTPGWIGGVSFALAIVLAIGARCVLRKSKPAARPPARDAAMIVAVDASAPVPVDAAVPDAPIDAPVVDAAPPSPPPPDAAPVQPSSERPRPRPNKLQECSRDPDTECVLLACRKQEEAKARAWFSYVPQRDRTNVIAQCLIEGIDLAPKPN